MKSYKCIYVIPRPGLNPCSWAGFVVAGPSLCKPFSLCKHFSFSFIFLFFYKNRDIAKFVKIIEKSKKCQTSFAAQLNISWTGNFANYYLMKSYKCIYVIPDQECRLKVQERSQSPVHRQIRDTLTKKITEVDMMHKKSYKGPYWVIETHRYYKKIKLRYTYS